MATLAVSVVGAGAGFIVGGPTGAAIGWSLGAAVGSILFGPDAPNTRGPRLDDVTVQASTQGQPINRIYGKMRTSGNLFWSTDLEEHKHKEDIEGGKGGGGGSQTTFTYTANFAIGLCEGPIIAVLRIWADGKLIFDQQDSDDINALVLSSDVADEIRVYPGDESQLPDSLIQSVEGVENTPAYRGTAYLVFDDFELADFGNRIPNITAEVVTAATTGYLGPIVDDRPQTTGGTIVESSSNNDDGGYLFQRANDGVIDYIGNVQYHDGNTTTRTFYRRRYNLDGEFQDMQTITISVAGPAYFTGTSPSSLLILGPVRGTSDVYAASIREQSSEVANYACWVRPGLNPYVVPLRTPNNEPFAELENNSYVPGVSESSVHLFPISQAFGENIYALLGPVEGSGNKRVYKFPYDDGAPSYQAEAEYIGDQAGTFDDLTVDAAGVWIIGAQPSVVPAEGFLIHLDHDLEFVEQWTIPNPQDVRLIGPAVRGNVAIYGAQGGENGQWFVVSLNEDGTATTLATGTATGSGEQQGYPPIIAGVGLLQRRQWIMFGVFQGEPVTLASIVADLCERSGLTSEDFDVSNLEDDLVTGYEIPRPISAREAMEPLQRGYYFDVIESDFKLKFPQRGGDSIATIPEAQLAAHQYGSERPVELFRRRKQDLELPRRVHVQHIQEDRDYQAGEQWAGRLQTRATAVEIVTLPIVFTPDEARSIADALLYDAWVSRDEYAFSLGPEYIGLDPADTVTITHGNGTHYVRLTNVDFQIPGLMACRGVSVRPPSYGVAEVLTNGSLHNTYESNAPGADSPVDQPEMLGLEGPSEVVLIDSVLLRDADDNAGIYHAGRGYASGWRGYGIFKSLDDGATFTQIDTNFTAATMGRTTDTLDAPASGVTVIDQANTLNVRVNGELSSVTDALFYNRTQLALVGVHGRWEVIAFQDAALESDGTYTISTLMRGLKGTDHNTANHAVGDYFILLSASTIDRMLVDVAEIGVERIYKGVSAGQTIQETDPQEFTLSLEGLKPLSPVHVRGKRNTSLDWEIRWIRRTRIGGAWDVAGFTPLGEASESYSIDILNGSTVVRTIADSASPATYTAAQQTTDFGSTQSTINGRIYQVSATVGRGTARSFTLTI